jgi:hypothetical protein
VCIGTDGREWAPWTDPRAGLTSYITFISIIFFQVNDLIVSNLFANYYTLKLQNKILHHPSLPVLAEAKMQSDRLPQISNDGQSNTDQSDDVTNSNNALLRAKIENYPTDTLNWESTGNKDSPRKLAFWKRVFHTAMPAFMSFAV